MLLKKKQGSPNFINERHEVCGEKNRKTDLSAILTMEVASLKVGYVHTNDSQ
jgi:hypothetical protein